MHKEHYTRKDNKLVCLCCGGRTPIRYPVHKPGCDYVAGFAGLTARQVQVAILISEGKTAKDIGASLGLSHKTVEAHKNMLYRRLSVHTIAELTRAVVEAQRGTAAVRMRERKRSARYTAVVP